MAKVFITGITGFLGSSIARYLVDKGHDIIGLYRHGSSLQLLESIENKITLVLQENDWVSNIISHKPHVVIHAAWAGVGHNDRDNWDSQLLNIDYLKQVLTIGKNSGAVKFIGLGSQAEYGTFNGMIDEHYPASPKEAYGCVKVICTEFVKQYCNYYDINWYWLRLFSFYGKEESERWLIPSMVKKMLTEKEMDLTEGEQRYAYLYVGDLGLAINNIIVKPGRSGIYNISGSSLIKLRDLVERIRDVVNKSFTLNFGRLPYRANQSMHIQGNSLKFKKEFGEFEVSDFDASLLATINGLIKRFK